MEGSTKEHILSHLMRDSVKKYNQLGQIEVMFSLLYSTGLLCYGKDHISTKKMVLTQNSHSQGACFVAIDFDKE